MPAKNVPSFVATSQAWYAATALDGLHERLVISSADRQGEMFLEWKDNDAGPSLRVHHDDWGVMLRDFTGILRHISMLKPAPPADVCAYLVRMGFQDETERERPAETVVAWRSRGEVN